MPIEDLDLTVRSYNCLKREGIHTVGELVSRSEADLLDIRNFGAKSIDEVKMKLVGMGLQLKDSPPGFDLEAAEYGSDDGPWDNGLDAGLDSGLNSGLDGVLGGSVEGGHQTEGDSAFTMGLGGGVYGAEQGYYGDGDDGEDYAETEQF
jgi:DNA-directed RNA polymerase subunit alpha